MSTKLWMVSSAVRSLLTAALLLWLGAPSWAAVLGAVVVLEAATAARAAGRFA